MQFSHESLRQRPRRPPRSENCSCPHLEFRWKTLILIPTRGLALRLERQALGFAERLGRLVHLLLHLRHALLGTVVFAGEELAELGRDDAIGDFHPSWQL